MKKLLLPLLVTVTSTISPFSCLWAPWRNPAVAKQTQQKAESSQGLKEKACVFCHDAHTEDRYENLILLRTDTICVGLNPKPYTPSALLIWPVQHCTTIDDLDDDVLHELWQAAMDMMELYRMVFDVESFNVGMSVGPNSGRSHEHLHIHVVPRSGKQLGWMETTCDTMVHDIHMGAIYSRLLEFM